MKIKIGTRASKLALWQAYHIQNLLEGQGLITEIVKIETRFELFHMGNPSPHRKFLKC